METKHIKKTVSGKVYATTANILFIALIFVLHSNVSLGQGFNTTPTFTFSPGVNLSAAAATTLNDINALAVVSDTDHGQLLKWSISSLPARGTLTGFPTYANSGGPSIAPAGLGYTVNAGQTGTDSFQLQVSDGIKSSTITFSVALQTPVQTPPADTVVSVLPGKNIVSVQEFTGVTVPFGTDYGSLQLPGSAQVSYADNVKDTLGITWYQSNFNGRAAGSYLLLGDLLLETGYSNTKYLKARFAVTVLANRMPSEMTLSDTILGATNLAQPDQPSNTLTTIDADDSVHTYQLAEGAGDTDNCSFRVLGGAVSLKNLDDLKGKKEFSIRVRSTDTENNSIERVFKLYLTDEELAQIEIPNTFSPNGDGINDVWIVPALKGHQGVDIKVFDGIGALLFHTSNPEVGWDGRNQYGKVVAGLYFYSITIGDINLKKQDVLVLLNR